MSGGSAGSDLMKQISRGELAQRSSDYALEIKSSVSTALVELITVGARIRPLKLRGTRVGWLRSFSFSEKEQLDIWFEDEKERIVILLLHATTLSKEDILSLDMAELNTILRSVLHANLADLSLFPYIMAFASTQASINIWSSRHEDLFKPRTIVMPDGGVLKQLTPSDHIKLWSSLSTIRDATILKLEHAMDSAIIARAFSQGAESYMNSLSKALNGYAPDNLEPWLNCIDFVSYNSKKKELNDGFGHSHEDMTTEGLMREMNGMMKGDKHETLMKSFYDYQMAQEKEKQKRAEALIANRKAALISENQESYVVMTEAEVAAKEREIREQTYGWIDRANMNNADQEGSSEELSESDKIQRLQKYQ